MECGGCHQLRMIRVVCQGLCDDEHLSLLFPIQVFSPENGGAGEAVMTRQRRLCPNDRGFQLFGFLEILADPLGNAQGEKEVEANNCRAVHACRQKRKLSHRRFFQLVAYRENSSLLTIRHKLHAKGISI